VSDDRRQLSISLRNDRNEELPVFVEPWPEHYKLREGETLKIVFEPRMEVPVIDIVAHDEGLSIHPEFGDSAEITIDGKDATNRSWTD
jgi:hypothetical protein